MEELRRINNIPLLVLDGPGVPAAPREETWKEDILATTRTVLDKYMPSTEIRDTDVVQCYRANRGRKIVCQFARYGPGSVRDAIYDGRMSLRKDARGQERERDDQVFINEMLTPGAHTAYLKLRAAKKQGRIHTVYTKHGYIYVRLIQHGEKIRISNSADCERVLRGDQAAAS